MLLTTADQLWESVTGMRLPILRRAFERAKWSVVLHGKVSQLDKVLAIVRYDPLLTFRQIKAIVDEPFVTSTITQAERDGVLTLVKGGPSWDDWRIVPISRETTHLVNDS